MFERMSTPLCPAGHLSHKGREQIAGLLSPTSGVVANASKLLFSPLVGEMSGRTERGAAPTLQISFKNGPHHA
jgi:hypothetical protein